MRTLLVLIFGSFSMAISQVHATVLDCALQYQVPLEDGSIRFVTPKNGLRTQNLVPIKVCNEKGCSMREVGTAFLGSGIGGASVRINGDRTVIILRDARGNRSAVSFNTAGLRADSEGGAAFSLNAEGFYNDEAFNAIIFGCVLKP